jgi:hypothetical protein
MARSDGVRVTIRMLRDRYNPQDLFTQIPQLCLQFEPVVAHEEVHEEYASGTMIEKIVVHVREVAFTKLLKDD